MTRILALIIFLRPNAPTDRSGGFEADTGAKDVLCVGRKAVASLGFEDDIPDPAPFDAGPLDTGLGIFDCLRILSIGDFQGGEGDSPCVLGRNTGSILYRTIDCHRLFRHAEPTKKPDSPISFPSQ